MILLNLSVKFLVGFKMKFKEVVSFVVLVTSAKSCITQVRLVYSVPNLENPFRQVCDTGRDLMTVKVCWLTSI